ncbi:hypothetical protein V6Z12_D05G244600 [Gossypium hirsutum]
MHFASISFHCWFFVPLPVLCSSSPLKKSLVLCSSSPPPVTSQETNLVARCRRVYGHAHDYHINFIQITACTLQQSVYFYSWKHVLLYHLLMRGVCWK